MCISGQVLNGSRSTSTRSIIVDHKIIYSYVRNSKANRMVVITQARVVNFRT